MARMPGVRPSGSVILEFLRTVYLALPDFLSRGRGLIFPCDNLEQLLRRHLASKLDDDDAVSDQPKPIRRPTQLLDALQRTQHGFPDLWRAFAHLDPQLALRAIHGCGHACHTSPSGHTCGGTCGGPLHSLAYIQRYFYPYLSRRKANLLKPTFGSLFWYFDFFCSGYRPSRSRTSQAEGSFWTLLGDFKHHFTCFLHFRT